MRKLSTHEEAQRLAYGTVKNIAKVQVCNLRLTDNIEQIGHSDANIEWLSGIKTAFEFFRTLFFLELFGTLSNVILNVSNFTTMMLGLGINLKLKYMALES